MVEKIAIKDKWVLSVEEAAAYFRVGESRLRNYIRTNPDEDYLISIGNRILIKRQLFEQHINKITSI